MAYQDPSEDPYAGLFADDVPRPPVQTYAPPPGMSPMGAPEPAWRQLRQPAQADVEAELVVLDPVQPPALRSTPGQHELAHSPSWLMQPDDARGMPPPARFDPNALVPAPVSASFGDQTRPFSGGATWLVRGFVALAGLCMVLVIVKIAVMKKPGPREELQPLVPSATKPYTAPELADPRSRSAERLNNRGNKPASVILAAPEPEEGTVQATLDTAPAPVLATVAEAPPPAPVVNPLTALLESSKLRDVDDPALIVPPQWSSGTAPASGWPSDRPARERIERWLAVHSSAAAPGADVHTWNATPQRTPARDASVSVPAQVPAPMDAPRDARAVAPAPDEDAVEVVNELEPFEAPPATVNEVVQVPTPAATLSELLQAQKQPAPVVSSEVVHAPTPQVTVGAVQHDEGSSVGGPVQAPSPVSAASEVAQVPAPVVSVSAVTQGPTAPPTLAELLEAQNPTAGPVQVPSPAGGASEVVQVPAAGVGASAVTQTITGPLSTSSSPAQAPAAVAQAPAAVAQAPAAVAQAPAAVAQAPAAVAQAPAAVLTLDVPDESVVPVHEAGPAQPTDSGTLVIQKQPGTKSPAPAPSAAPVLDAPSGTWEGHTVPMEQIAGAARILTPDVGRVQVALDGGGTFEGRLYAVGQGRIWLDTELGRMALFRDQIERIEQLVTNDAHAKQRSSVEIAALPRMRVRSAGGVFYGKILAREGQRITLLTDEGARVTVESNDVSAATKTDTVIKHDPKAATKQPAPKPKPPAKAKPKPGGGKP
jgi:hypothetical protein